MGGNSADKQRPGRENEKLAAKGGGSGNIAVPASIGTLGRDQKLKEKKEPKVLLKGGKVQPGTMAFRLAEALQAKAATAKR